MGAQCLRRGAHLGHLGADAPQKQGGGWKETGVGRQTLEGRGGLGQRGGPRPPSPRSRSCLCPGSPRARAWATPLWGQSTGQRRRARMHDPCPQPGLGKCPWARGSRHSGHVVGVHALGSDCVPESILLCTRVCVCGCVNSVCWWLSRERAGNGSVGGPGWGGVPRVGGEPRWEGMLGGQGGLQEGALGQGDLAGEGVLGGGSRPGRGSGPMGKDTGPGSGGRVRQASWGSSPRPTFLMHSVRPGQALSLAGFLLRP